MPVAHNTPGFVSFNDYLDANAGSLSAERNAALAGATAAGDKARADLTQLGAQATDAGAKAAQDAGPLDPHASAAAPGFDPTTLGGYSAFLADKKKALDAMSSLSDPSRAADKYSPFESGLINASGDYQGKAKGLQDQYGKALDNYLGPLGQAFGAGYQTHVQFKPIEPSAGAGTPDTGSTPTGATDDSGIDRGTGRYPSGGGPYSGPTPGATDDSGVDRSGGGSAGGYQPPTKNPDEDPYGASWGGGG